MTDYLLVHGGFNGGWVWDDVVELLDKAGHRTRVVEQLPSAGTDASSLGDLSADANHVRRTLDTMDGPVVLVGHSFAGMVITEFADHPKVRHSVYLTAFWPQRGQSALNQLGDQLPSVFIRRDDGALQVIDDFTQAWQAFCVDVDRGAAQKLLSRFVLQSAESFVVPSTAPVRNHPTTYVVTTKETDASVAGQEAWAAKADYVVRLPAGHMVQLSVPDALAQVLGRI
jgi:pimeloyl-ACP methyl ester carboxylesterase